jgi:small subunit ribosomal protein S6
MPYFSRIKHQNHTEKCKKWDGSQKKMNFISLLFFDCGFVLKKNVPLQSDILIILLFNSLNIISSMVNRYEAVFIMTPVLSDEQMKETVNKFEQIMLDNGCEIIYQKNWGMRKLAYPIMKKTSGFYHLFDFKADGSFIKEFETQLKRDERIIRYLTVALDKHAIVYNDKRYELKQQKNNEEK